MSQFTQNIAAPIADADYREAVLVACIAADVARGREARREAARLEFAAAKVAFLEARARIQAFAIITTQNERPGNQRAAIDNQILHAFAREAAEAVPDAVPDASDYHEAVRAIWQDNLTREPCRREKAVRFLATFREPAAEAAAEEAEGWSDECEYRVYLQTRATRARVALAAARHEADFREAAEAAWREFVRACVDDGYPPEVEAESNEE